MNKKLKILNDDMCNCAIPERVLPIEFILVVSMESQFSFMVKPEGSIEFIYQ